MSEINRRKFTVLGGTALTASLLTAGQVFAKMTQGGRSTSRSTSWSRVSSPGTRSASPMGRWRSSCRSRTRWFMCIAGVCALPCPPAPPAQGTQTPTGVFTILQKDKHHRSSTYNNAPMPNMNRLTWSGIALHAGNLPGYPASHGCIRLPVKFSQLLFTVTHLGTPVILANGHSQPRQVVHPGMVLSDYAEHEFEELTGKHFKTAAAQRIPQHQEGHTTTAVLVSRESEEIMVLENGRIVAKGRAFIKNPGQPLGDHVFILDKPHNGRKGLAWHAIGHHPKLANATITQTRNTIKRIGADKKIIAPCRSACTPAC
jgi:hypothetical protein